MKQTMKRITAVLVAVCLCMLSVVSVFAQQDGPDVKAEAYCVINRKDGSIVYSKNMDDRYYPASITKIMTALVTLEHCTDLDDTVVFNSEVMDSISSNSSTLNPVAILDEEMTVRDALFGLMLNSANECASALAVYTAGSIDAFVEMMNEKAQELGAVNTHYMNAHGLDDDDHYTTAHDMAIIFDENNRLITLNTKNSTYQMKIDEYGFLLHLYYGKRTNGNMDYILVNLDRGFSGNPYDAGDNRKYSLDALLQEFPCRGAGDFRSPVFEVRYEDGSFGCDLRYESHIIKDGKDEVLVSLNEKDNNITFSDIELSSNAYRIIEKSAGLFKSNSTVEIYNTTSKKQNIYNFNGVAKKVYSYGNIIAIDLGSEVLFINMNGWLIKKYNSVQDIKNIVLTDNLAGIVYRDKIEFISL